jgi:hypothetical protein
MTLLEARAPVPGFFFNLLFALIQEKPWQQKLK